jgi:hypothetical protein
VAVERALGWERLNALVAEVEKVVMGTREDNLSEIVDRYPIVHRMVPILLGAFVCRAVGVDAAACGLPHTECAGENTREIGRLERTLFTLDWISDPALRRRSNAGLNKGEARNALARWCSFTVSAKSVTAPSKISDTGLLASISPLRLSW